ncbi:hypothetical protein L1987_35459 [Smallanthus sonchifolius]|uniref:Uncharacterized protein n=1 Tax=Smallanthus sonchifolius TaxID=185202 RepID=A0ACB9HWN5_9ASTR|nr:hypothetical protein L1987_35459 [Smallanthus sonchifolius]
MVKDGETGNSKSYAFCAYQNVFVTDIACAAINCIKMGDRILTVNQGQIQPEPEQESILALMRLQPEAIGTLPTNVVSLTQLVTDTSSMKIMKTYWKT